MHSGHSMRTHSCTHLGNSFCQTCWLQASGYLPSTVGTDIPLSSPLHMTFPSSSSPLSTFSVPHFLYPQLCFFYSFCSQWRKHLCPHLGKFLPACFFSTPFKESKHICNLSFKYPSFILSANSSPSRPLFFTDVNSCSAI